jgi:hypothetical protein
MKEQPTKPIFGYTYWINELARLTDCVTDADISQLHFDWHDKPLTELHQFVIRKRVESI